jgi:hypothetical protein
MSDDKHTTPEATPAPTTRAGSFKLPSKAELRKARNDAKKASKATADVPAGTVIGLDTDSYVPALIDLTLPDARIAYYRRRYENKGYVKLDGAPIVVGYEACEVWVKAKEDHDVDRRERRHKIEGAVIAGRMAKSALGPRASVDASLPAATVVI